MALEDRFSSFVMIEEMTVQDMEQIMAIEKVSFPTPWSENMFRKELKVSMSRNFVARIESEGGKELIGYMNYWIYAGESHLNNIAVRRDYRRKGIASKLMAEMIRKSLKEGAAWGTLEVRRTNGAAVRLYERYGYTLKGVRPNYYDDTKEDGLIMWCDFKESMKKVVGNDL
jgi:[ribosomal protein S18]-alanine N-acetyltransferase